MNGRELTALFLATILALPAPLLAQSRGKPSVVVGGIALRDADEPYRKSIQSALFQAFEEDRRISLASRKQILDWWKRERRATDDLSPSDQLKEARELLVDGKKAYQHLDLKRASKYLQEARREFIMNLHHLRSNRDLLDAHLYLGVTYLALKEKKKGMGELRRVAYLDPKRELSARDFPPSVLEAFATVKQEVHAAAPVHVRVTSVPARAEVYLNGRLIGKTPMETRLASGEYFVLMEKKGTTPWYKPISISRSSREVRAVLEADREVKRWGTLFRVREGGDQRSGDVKKLEEMAGSVGADYVFLGRVERLRDYRILGQLYDSRTSDFSKVAVVAASTEMESVSSVFPDLVETLLSFIGPDGRLIGGKPQADLDMPPGGLTVGQANRPKKPATYATAPKPKAWYQKWWIYPLIAGAGVGIYFGAKQLGGTGGSSIDINNAGNY